MLAMGINWSMEIISWVINWLIVRVPNEAWYFTDFLNAAYGVFIFFIFVFKKSIWKLLKKRYITYFLDSNCFIDIKLFAGTTCLWANQI